MHISPRTYSRIKAKEIQGRYIGADQLTGFLKGLDARYNLKVIGSSVEHRPISSVSIGSGKTRVLMWSQMHGNEATTTKAVLDLLNLLTTDHSMSQLFLEQCTLMIIPMLNPDGATAYTRVNANAVDLNRDAQNRTQPESQVLRAAYEDFQPDFCFNLHDQRTIYNVGETSKPATVSFLAPAHDAQRTISRTRALSMQLIVAMKRSLEEHIPGQIGRYDDAFNANCVGDTFQMLHTPTILFEAGHTPNDYAREKTRNYIFIALVSCLEVIANNTFGLYRQEAYFEIPENQKQYFDILVKNVPVAGSSSRNDRGILYKEVLADGEISFIPEVVQKGNLTDFYGHETYDYLKKSDIGVLKQKEIDLFGAN